MLLEHGDVVEEGDPSRIGNRYLELNFSEPGAERDSDDDDRYGDGRAEILEAWFEDARGGRATLLPTGEPGCFAARVRFNAEVADPLFGVNLLNSDRVPVLSASNVLAAPQTGRFAEGEEAVFRIRFHNVFAAGRLFATPAVAQSGSGFKWLDRRERLASVVVSSTRETDAVTDLDYDFALERAQARV
jgi:hypothetical protein